MKWMGEGEWAQKLQTSFNLKFHTVHQILYMPRKDLKCNSHSPTHNTFLLPVWCDHCRTGPPTLILGKCFVQSTVDDHSHLWWRLILCCRLYAPYFQLKRWAELHFWLQNPETWVLAQWVLLFLFPEREKKKRKIILFKKSQITFDPYTHMLTCPSTPPTGWAPFPSAQGHCEKRWEQAGIYMVQTCRRERSHEYLKSGRSLLSHPSVSVFSPCLQSLPFKHLLNPPFPSPCCCPPPSHQHFPPCPLC